MRGVKQPAARMLTSAMLGVFETDAELRRELMARLAWSGSGPAA
jgi:GTP cyclohydrolase I